MTEILAFVDDMEDPLHFVFDGTYRFEGSWFIMHTAKEVGEEEFLPIVALSNASRIQFI